MKKDGELLGQVSRVIEESWPTQCFDHLAFATIDFAHQTFSSLLYVEAERVAARPIYFDLASLTKPLTLASYFHRYPEKLTKTFELLLNHRAGLKAWAVLGRKSWRDQLLAYEVKESGTIYSDLSALRLMLEIEKREECHFQELCSFFWHPEMKFWQDLHLDHETPTNGFRRKHRIVGEVNDDNCYRINRFCSHAGLFATVEGLSQSLLQLNQLTGFVGKMNRDHQHRFDHGWDTVANNNTLAGQGAGDKTFGHLGFTGTSCWIDPHKELGWVLLTNVTKDYWFEREALNDLRRKLGSIVWCM